MTTIDLTHIDTPANMNHWALFHNGCAAGLKIAPDSQVIYFFCLLYWKIFFYNENKALFQTFSVIYQIPFKYL